MKRRMMVVLVTFLAVSLPGVIRAEENWPQWRGPQGDGTSTSTNLPTTWSLEQNIIWKTDLPAWSGGTPIIWGDRIFIMSPSKSAAAAPVGASTPSESSALQLQPGGNVFAQQEPGRGQGDRGPGGRGPGGRRGFGRGGRDPGGQTLFLFCFSRKDGHKLWEYELDTGNQLYNKGNSTSPSPVTDGKHVWVLSGNGVLACLDMDGHEIWTKKIQDLYGRFGLNWGYASSPFLYDGKLIVQVLHGMKTDDPSYLVALEPLTGKQIWRVERPTDALSESPDSYTTPTVLKVGGQTQLVITGGDYVTGHDLNSGVELWRVDGLNPRKDRNYRIIASPLVVGDMIFAPTRKSPLLAIAAQGPKEMTTRWQWNRNGGTDVPTPVSDGKYFYMIAEDGLISCADLKTGEPVWGPQRSGAGTVWSSPLLADGKLYVVNENGATYVFAAGPEYKLLATNELDGSYTLSTPVAVDNRLYIRTGQALYCIGEKATP